MQLSLPTWLMPVTRTALAPRQQRRQLVGRRVILREAEARDFDEWRVLRAASRAHLEPWEPLWPENALERRTYLRRLRQHSEEWANGLGHHFIICLNGLSSDRPSGTATLEREPIMPSPSGAEPTNSWQRLLAGFAPTDPSVKGPTALGGSLVGGVSLSQVRRGAVQSATIGYWLGQAHTGQGFMAEAVRLVLEFAFRDLGLHRIEAACVPDNARSRAVLKRAGFLYEGYAREYLCIAGAWRDHLLFALTRTDWQGGLGPTGMRPNRERASSPKP